MDQPAVGAETFVLRTNIQSRACEKKMKEFLEDIKGVHGVFVDPIEIGKIKISGDVDPQKLMKILRDTGINSELVSEPMMNRRDLPNVLRPKSPVENFHVNIDVTRNGMNLTYKKYENVQHLDGKNGSCSRNMHENAMHKKGEHVMKNDSEFHGNYESRFSRNQGMYVQYCHCCRTNCRYMASHEGTSIGIPSPVPEYIPSAPPMPAGYDPDPCSQEQYSDHLSSHKFSDDNPTGIVVFFFLLFFILLILSAL